MKHNYKFLIITILFFIHSLLNAQAIGTGPSYHTIVVDNNGFVSTWGRNAEGQLGNESNISSNVPVAVSTSGVLNGKTISQVAVGLYFSIALASDGTVYTWGINNYGQLGNGNNTDSNIPVAVTTSGVLAGKTITAVAAGYYHSIVLTSDGTIYAWGFNGNGQLGNENNTDSNIPVAVTTSGVLAGKTITTVAAGTYHSIALASDGTVYTWGINNSGQLGNGNNTNSNVPLAVSTSGVLNGKTIIAVATGGYQSIVLASDGTVYTWGDNFYGQLGNGNNTNSNVPVVVSTSGVLNGKTITAVAAGFAHSICLASDATVYTWGFNGNGQLGNGNNTNSNVPLAVTTSGVLAGQNISNVASGDMHLIALASDGKVYTWGSNDNGQLGNGTNTNSNVPVLSNVTPLPVELTTFTANVNDNSVSLNWETATEVNNYGFNVERQMQVSSSENQDENQNWEKITFINGHGNSNSPKFYNFEDNSLITSGKYFYRLKQIDIDGTFEYSNIAEVNIEVDLNLPVEFELRQNYPNPFNPTTTINYSVPVADENFRPVQLKIYDVLGTEIATLVNEQKVAGRYKVIFDASKLSNGIYFYTLQSGLFSETKKLMLLK